MVRDRVLETLRLAAPELKSGVSAIPPIPHIVVPFTQTVSLKSGWDSWTRTNESGSQSPLPYHLAIPQYTNRFIHPTYCNRYGLWGFRRQSWISTSAYTAQRKGGFKLMHYQPHIRCNIAYTPWPSAYCPPHVPLVTSAILHLFCPSCYPTFSRTRTRAISFSLRIVGQSF